MNRCFPNLGSDGDDLLADRNGLYVRIRKRLRGVAEGIRGCLRMIRDRILSILGIGDDKDPIQVIDVESSASSSSASPSVSGNNINELEICRDSTSFTDIGFTENECDHVKSPENAPAQDFPGFSSTPTIQTERNTCALSNDVDSVNQAPNDFRNQFRTSNVSMVASTYEEKPQTCLHADIEMLDKDRANPWTTDRKTESTQESDQFGGLETDNVLPDDRQSTEELHRADCDVREVIGGGWENTSFHRDQHDIAKAVLALVILEQRQTTSPDPRMVTRRRIETMMANRTESQEQIDAGKRDVHKSISPGEVSVPVPKQGPGFAGLTVSPGKFDEDVHVVGEETEHRSMTPGDIFEMFSRPMVQGEEKEGNQEGQLIVKSEGRERVDAPNKPVDNAVATHIEGTSSVQTNGELGMVQREKASVDLADNNCNYTEEQITEKHMESNEKDECPANQENSLSEPAPDSTEFGRFADGEEEFKQIRLKADETEDFPTGSVGGFPPFETVNCYTVFDSRADAADVSESFHNNDDDEEDCRGYEYDSDGGGDGSYDCCDEYEDDDMEEEEGAGPDKATPSGIQSVQRQATTKKRPRQTLNVYHDESNFEIASHYCMDGRILPGKARRGNIPCGLLRQKAKSKRVKNKEQREDTRRGWKYYYDECSPVRMSQSTGRLDDETTEGDVGEGTESNSKQEVVIVQKEDVRHFEALPEVVLKKNKCNEPDDDLDDKYKTAKKNKNKARCQKKTQKQRKNNTLLEAYGVMKRRPLQAF